MRGIDAGSAEECNTESERGHELVNCVLEGVGVEVEEEEEVAEEEGKEERKERERQGFGSGTAKAVWTFAEAVYGLQQQEER